MAEKSNNNHGGKRVGAGRPSNSRSKVKVLVALKMDADLNNVFDSHKSELNKGRYINDAVRAKMLADGYIKEVEQLESVKVEDVEYVRHKGNDKSSCVQCDLKDKCWDMWQYSTPCCGGFYKKK